MAKQKKLTEIVLTANKGYVIKETNEPVEIIGGCADSFGCFALNDELSITANIEDAIRDGYVHQLPRIRINGYIHHHTFFVDDDSISESQRRVKVILSAVKYRKK